MKSTHLAVVAGLTYLAVRSLRFAHYRDQIVVITGGSRGLGFALAQNLIRRGATVILLARNNRELQAASEKLGPRAIGIRCDVTVEGDLARAVDRVMKDFGRIDTFIHNAGLISVGPFNSFTDRDFKNAIDLHLQAAIASVRILQPILKPGSRMCFISSVGGKVAMPHMSAYSATKFALGGFADAVRPELAASGISLTVAYPGLMRTGSPKNAVVKGDTESEFFWFAAADQLPLISMGADRAARKILNAVLDRRSEIIVGWSARVLVAVRALMPELTALSMQAVNAFLPPSESQRGVKGSQARSKFDQSTLVAPLRALEQSAQKEWNQQV